MCNWWVSQIRSHNYAYVLNTMQYFIFWLDNIYFNQTQYTINENASKVQLTVNLSRKLEENIMLCFLYFDVSAFGKLYVM